MTFQNEISWMEWFAFLKPTSNKKRGIAQVDFHLASWLRKDEQQQKRSSILHRRRVQCADEGGRKGLFVSVTEIDPGAQDWHPLWTAPRAYPRHCLWSMVSPHFKSNDKWWRFALVGLRDEPPRILLSRDVIASRWAVLFFALLIHVWSQFSAPCGDDGLRWPILDPNQEPSFEMCSTAGLSSDSTPSSWSRLKIAKTLTLVYFHLNSPSCFS